MKRCHFPWIHAPRNFPFKDPYRREWVQQCCFRCSQADFFMWDNKRHEYRLAKYCDNPVVWLDQEEPMNSYDLYDDEVEYLKANPFRCSLCCHLDVFHKEKGACNITKCGCKGMPDVVILKPIEFMPR